MLWITQQYDAGKFIPVSRLRGWANRRSPHIARCIRFTSVPFEKVWVTPAHRRNDRLHMGLHERWEYFEPETSWRDVPVPFTPREVFDRVRESYAWGWHACDEGRNGHVRHLNPKRKCETSKAVPCHSPRRFDHCRSGDAASALELHAVYTTNLCAWL
jgi:hypothetical protein